MPSSALRWRRTQRPNRWNRRRWGCDCRRHSTLIDSSQFSLRCARKNDASSSCLSARSSVRCCSVLSCDLPHKILPNSKYDDPSLTVHLTSGSRKHVTPDRSSKQIITGSPGPGVPAFDFLMILPPGSIRTLDRGRVDKKSLFAGARRL